LQTENFAEAVIVPHRIIWSWYTDRWWVGYVTFGTARRGLRGKKNKKNIRLPETNIHLFWQQF